MNIVVRARDRDSLTTFRVDEVTMRRRAGARVLLRGGAANGALESRVTDMLQRCEYSLFCEKISRPSVLFHKAHDLLEYQ